MENINSIEQLLSKIQRVGRKCELGFDADITLKIYDDLKTWKL